MTLLAARWALEERARSAEAIDTPTVILALPMISIVDQTEKAGRDLLGVADDDGDTLLPYHSLSEHSYDPELDRGTAEFCIDTWRSQVVVTTFDPFAWIFTPEDRFTNRPSPPIRETRL
jgi:CRISPR-associated endonuclease/helicase Cas3